MRVVRCRQEILVIIAGALDVGGFFFGLLSFLLRHGVLSERTEGTNWLKPRLELALDFYAHQIKAPLHCLRTRT